MKFLASRFVATALLSVAILTLAVLALYFRNRRSQEDKTPRDEGSAPNPAVELGVRVHDPRAFPGYTLIFPLSSTKTYLLDMQGKIVHQWQSRYTAGEMALLLENGHLLRAAKLRDSEAFFAGAGPGGRIQEFNWEGKLLWDYMFHDERRIQHHAITRMPNGNIMMLVWERKTPTETLQAGVKPDVSSKHDMLVDSLVEIRPNGVTGGQIVWEWHAWDHLVQDYDQTKPNFADVAAHPELIDANCCRNGGLSFGNLVRGLQPALTQNYQQADDEEKSGGKDDAVAKLKAIGYIGAGVKSKKFLGHIPDWTHFNSVDYNHKLDQILISSREFSEIWIIDHSTTTAQAKGHTGGRYGKGGDLLYRWGNPKNYRSGTEDDRKLFSQHDAQWIAEGLPGAGHILLFNNGPRPSGPSGEYSTVDEIAPPVEADGRYLRAPGRAFGPGERVWSYSATDKRDFFGRAMSGVQRLPNGNTLAATGFASTIWEVTPQGEVVWKYIVPSDSRPDSNRSPSGSPSFPPPPRSVQLVPDAILDAIEIKPEEKKELEELDKQLSAMLDRVLTEEQQKQLRDIQKRPGAPVTVGQIMPRASQDQLHLSKDQTEQIVQLQEFAGLKLRNLVKPQQLNLALTLSHIRQAVAGPGTAAIFRACRYGVDYPGLAGRDLTPGPTIDDLAKLPPVNGRR